MLEIRYDEESKVATIFNGSHSIKVTDTSIYDLTKVFGDIDRKKWVHSDSLNQSTLFVGSFEFNSINDWIKEFERQIVILSKFRDLAEEFGLESTVGYLSGVIVGMDMVFSESPIIDGNDFIWNHF